MSSDASTPLMRQYNGVKQKVPHALLMFRLGDFYELFFEDAVLAARELEITLTARNKEKGAAIPMCGVPYHVAGALEQLGAREVLFPGDLPLLAGDNPTGGAARYVRTELEEWIFTQDYA